MAANVSLTSSMRQNLLSLQSTNTLQEMTQYRLATGKKVNTALDNPTNYFTALSHMNRATDLLGFKDGISEAIQTIKAADAAISGITKLIESAKALAEDAKGALDESAYSQTLTIDNNTALSGGNTINIGGTTFTAVTSVGSQVAGGANFYIGDDAAATAFNLASQINNSTETRDMDATVNGGKLAISSASGTTMVGTDILFTGLEAIFSESDPANGAELTAKVDKYEDFMGQIGNLQQDAFYKGKNLLGGTAGDDMTVRFGNDHELEVASFDGSVEGADLNLSATATSNWSSEANITTDIESMEAALSTLRIKSADLSSNLAIITSREEWITNIAGILKDGADRLTLADTNEEGANMLMLQTRQVIGTSALSMSAQAAQSVLRLFS